MAQAAAASTEIGGALLPHLAALAGVDPLTGSLFSMTGNFMKASINSLFMILVTEIGDKTFFIAAVLAMRNARLVVYAGAMGALTLMHILSAMMGFALPNLIPRSYTHFASALLFVYFGLKLLKDSTEMSADGPSEELQEVEEELVKKKGEVENADDDEEESLSKGSSKVDLESAITLTASAVSTNSKGHVKKRGGYFGTENLQVFTQAFTLTFLAEWGDRSQIATIALASSQNPFGVVIGGLLGHAFCTGMAVIGGRMLAARISEKTVAIIGGVLFLFFAVTSFLWGPDA
jgi:putative Ca2+/H+ antiporter (TMEM165/GDT1 family)